MTFAEDAVKRMHDAVDDLPAEQVRSIYEVVDACFVGLAEPVPSPVQAGALVPAAAR
ncbi:MAG: hypothetical protein WKF96_01680 [Solirubrobacteraceae bacterium]